MVHFLYSGSGSLGGWVRWLETAEDPALMGGSNSRLYPSSVDIHSEVSLISSNLFERENICAVACDEETDCRNSSIIPYDQL